LPRRPPRRPPPPEPPALPRASPPRPPPPARGPRLEDDRVDADLGPRRRLEPERVHAGPPRVRGHVNGVIARDLVEEHGRARVLVDGELEHAVPGGADDDVEARGRGPLRKRRQHPGAAEHAPADARAAGLASRPALEDERGIDAL